MVFYFLWFFILAAMACAQSYALVDTPLKRRSWGPATIAAFIMLSLFIGLRYEVGGDWSTYLEHIEVLHEVPFLEFWQHGDPAYALLNWIGSNVFGSVYLVNTICGFLFCWGLFTFSQSQPRPWLALTVAFPYLILVVAMGYTRQGVAIGFLMLGLASLMKGSLLRFILWVVVASLFHKTVLIFLPLAVFSVSERPVLSAVGMLVTAGLAFVLMLQEVLDSLVVVYIDSEYGSAGAGFRVALNVVPAVLFLLFRQRFGLEDKMRRFWTWTSVSAIIFIGLLAVSPSTTAVDRLALYWIPLQLFVLGRLPDALGGAGRKNLLWVMLLAAYCASVLFFWLFFADHSSFWIPYRFYPAVALFEFFLI